MFILRKIVLISILNLFFISLNAQVWCPVGATWYYTRVNLSNYAYCKHTYTTDVVVGGKLCNKIDFSVTGVSQSGPFSGTATPYYTYVNNNVVYLYDAGANDFDTLFNYSANIGDFWKLATPNSNTFCASLHIDVVDTGHKNISGVNLKWLKVNITDGNTTVPDTIFERFGCLKLYMYDCPTMFDIDFQKGGPLRCYSDIQILNYNKTNKTCNYLPDVGVNENSLSSNHVQIYPNPVSKSIYIETRKADFKNSEIEIVDHLGQLVLKLPFNNEVDVSKLASGYYNLKITDQNKAFYYSKFIKE